MRIDLHTHSDRSDGTTAPADLVEHAGVVGVDVLGLTDHDTTEGWEEASAAALRTGVRLVPGIEVSCRFAGHGVHLLAYLPDPTYPPLVEELARILEGRRSRLPATLAKLRGLGVDLAADDVRRAAAGAVAMGRPHVADALVAKGVVRNRKEAFDSFLRTGGPAYVDRYAADLVAMLRTVTGAGGVSVLAHPWASRHHHEALDRSGLARLADAGLAGIEVDHQDHDAATRRQLRGLAAELDLVVTGSSDYHGAGKLDHEIGCNTTAPDSYQRLVDLAGAAAAASGRSAPAVVGA
ncbi:MAG TPA: PHP domain-containing protein [Nocardioidaceae bacterium]|nr:PHP domain-containing protein [Nocardioidaceae bacterium]